MKVVYNLHLAITASKLHHSLHYLHQDLLIRGRRLVGLGNSPISKAHRILYSLSDPVPSQAPSLLCQLCWMNVGSCIRTPSMYVFPEVLSIGKQTSHSLALSAKSTIKLCLASKNKLCNSFCRSD